MHTDTEWTMHYNATAFNGAAVRRSPMGVYYIVYSTQQVHALDDRILNQEVYSNNISKAITRSWL